MDIANKKILVTGGKGFFGSYILEELVARGVPATNIFALGSTDCDLTNLEDTMRIFNQIQPNIVIHAAAKVGGIGYNVKYPTAIFRDNIKMALNILDAAVATKLDKLVIVGSACMYPGALTGNFKEEDLLNGPLHPTVEVYGFSKRALLLGARAYHKEFGLPYGFVVPTNLYGPRDTFDPDRSHVVSALIRKFADAVLDKKPEVVCWGTGVAVREFIFASDAASAVVGLIEKDYVEPLNIGTGIGTSIKELAELTAKLTNFQGKIVWDDTKPDGALRKVLDITRMKSVLNLEPKVSLEDGLKRTIDWYIAHRAELK